MQDFDNGEHKCPRSRASSNIDGKSRLEVWKFRSPRLPTRARVGTAPSPNANKDLLPACPFPIHGYQSTQVSWLLCHMCPPLSMQDLAFEGARRAHRTDLLEHTLLTIVPGREVSTKWLSPAQDDGVESNCFRLHEVRLTRIQGPGMARSPGSV